MTSNLDNLHAGEERLRDEHKKFIERNERRPAAEPKTLYLDRI
jgi:hypothetical protein